MIELRTAGFDLEEIAGELGTSKFSVCRRIKELGEDLAKHAGLHDAVHRRQLKRTTMHEGAPPDSGVRPSVRGRPRRSQTPISNTTDMPPKRGRRAA